MSTVDLRAEILQLLQQEQSTSLLERIRTLLKRDGSSDGITEEELAELREIERRQESGEDAYVSLEEAMRMAREALKQ
jgi:ribonuclease D